MKYRRLFQELGLGEKSASAYEALLEHGGLTATQLADVLEVQRTVAYPVATELVTLGIVVRQKEDDVTVFRPEHPNALQRLLDKKQEEIDTAQGALDSHLDDLVNTYNAGESRAGVFRFEGLRGLQQSYAQLLKDGVSVCSIMDRNRLRTALGEYNKEWIEERKRRRMDHRVISPDSEKADKDDKTDRRMVRYVGRDVLDFNMDIKITEKKVVLTTFANEAITGVIISDPEISNNFQKLFNYFWDHLEE